MSMKTKTFLVLFLSVSIIFPSLIEAVGKDELILITNTRDGTISVISRTTNEVIKTINAGKKSNRISLSNDKQKAFIINDGSPFVRILDLKDFSFKKSAGQSDLSLKGEFISTLLKTYHFSQN